MVDVTIGNIQIVNLNLNQQTYHVWGHHSWYHPAINRGEHLPFIDDVHRCSHSSRHLKWGFRIAGG
jgi:hypothetical protein